MSDQKNEVAVYKPTEVRSEVIKQMESMSASKFVSLPESYKESVFFAMEKLSTMDDIDKVPAISVTKAFLKMFSNKLDFQKNHCYFFVQNDKDSPTGKSLRFGWQYQGLVSVAKRECDVKDVIPILINADDEFQMHYENGVLIIDKHIPTFKGEITGGYCVIEANNGDIRPKYYTRDELEQRRDKSKAKAGSFWAWEREMYEKTLINATIKRIIEMHTETNKEDLYAEPEIIDINHREVTEEIIQQPEPKVLTEKVQI